MNIKKIAGLLLGMIAGAFIGYGIALLIMLIVGGNEASASQNESIDWGKMVLAISITMVASIMSIFVHLILHEAGHLIAGLLTGYRFVSFRIFKYTLVKTPEGLRWKCFHIAGTGGQCILELPGHQDVEQAPWFWYNAGGVLMNIFIAAISIVLLKLADSGLVLYAILAMLAFVGVFMALMNGIPLVVGGISNDGHNL